MFESMPVLGLKTEYSSTRSIVDAVRLRREIEMFEQSIGVSAKQAVSEKLKAFKMDKGTSRRARQKKGQMPIAS